MIGSQNLLAAFNKMLEKLTDAYRGGEDTRSTTAATGEMAPKPQSPPTPLSNYLYRASIQIPNHAVHRNSKTTAINMAFVTSFTGATVTQGSTFTSTRAVCGKPTPKHAQGIVALASPIVDEFMASSVHRQYIQKACPSGVPPIQCVEGTTADEPYALRTLKRQSQLRYRQLPTSVRIHNYYEMRKAAVTAAHGCSHEEDRALEYPTMAAAYVMGQAEASKACIRYFKPAPGAETHMTRSVEQSYKAAINRSGVFSTSCTDGQARYEAYLMAVRGGSTRFRAHQYSTPEKEGMKFAARKQALAHHAHNCSFEEKIFCDFPIVASAMRPSKYPPALLQTVHVRDDTPTLPYIQITDILILVMDIMHSVWILPAVRVHPDARIFSRGCTSRSFACVAFWRDRQGGWDLRLYYKDAGFHAIVDRLVFSSSLVAFLRRAARARRCISFINSLFDCGAFLSHTCPRFSPHFCTCTVSVASFVFYPDFGH